MPMDNATATRAARELCSQARGQGRWNPTIRHESILYATDKLFIVYPEQGRNRFFLADDVRPHFEKLVQLVEKGKQAELALLLKTKFDISAKG